MAARPDDGSEAPRRWVVDRFEGGTAVVELDDGRFVDLPGELLPAGAAEGDLIEVTRSASEGAVTLILRIRPGGREEARGAAQAMLARLRARDPGGDIEL